MYTKFECDIFVRSSVIMKIFILSFIKQYRETTLRSLWTSSMTSSLWKYFFMHNLEWSFLFIISYIKLKLCFIFGPFQNGRHFEVAKNFFTWSDTGIWICYKDSHEHLWHFELLIDVLAQILTELLEFKVLTYFWDPMTSSMKQSTIVCKGIFTIQWYICAFSLKMISL